MTPKKPVVTVGLGVVRFIQAFCRRDLNDNEILFIEHAFGIVHGCTSSPDETLNEVMNWVDMAQDAKSRSVSKRRNR